MRRRNFISLAGGAAAWPLAARAQPAAMPVVGYIAVGFPEPVRDLVAAFHRGLNETGYSEGRNVVVECRRRTYEDYLIDKDGQDPMHEREIGRTMNTGGRQ